MIFCRTFSCVLGPSRSFRHTIRLTPNYGHLEKLLNIKCLFETGIRSVAKKTGSKRSSIWKRSMKNMNVVREQFVGKKPSAAILWKPCLFTVCFSAGTLALCAIWQYENVRKRAKDFLNLPNMWTSWRSSKRFEWRDKFHKEWNYLREGEKWFAVVCLINIVVYLLWKVPTYRSRMIRYFTSNPFNSANCWPLLFLTFSHSGLMHLGVNMYALHSFSELAINELGKEQLSAFYLAGGVFSSLTSLFFRVLSKSPDISLGASGAILAVLVYTALKYPDLQLTVLGIPAFTFAAKYAVKALILFDLTGLILRWKLLDHAAHLGGACFGIFWYYWGNPYIWGQRESFLKWWHELRNSVK